MHSSGQNEDGEKEVCQDFVGPVVVMGQPGSVKLGFLLPAQTG